MSAIEHIRKALVVTQASTQERREAAAGLRRVVYALRHLTAEHGTQCRCPGCEVLREGT